MTRVLMIASILLVLAGSVEASSRTNNRRTTLAKRAAIYEPYILRAAARYGVDPRLLWTIAYLESRFNPRAVSPKGARGLMQFMPATARTYGLRNPYEPISSIDAAARYVRDLSIRFGGRRDLILAAYNAGEYAVVRAGYNVPRYRETRKYVAHANLLLGSENRLTPTRTLHRGTGESLSVTTRQLVRGSSVLRSAPTRSIYFSR